MQECPVRPPIPRVPAIDAKKPAGKPSMVFKRFQIATGMQFAKCITQRQGFVAVVVEPNRGMGPEAWYVGVAYLPAGTGAELLKVCNHLSRDTIGSACSPQSLSISAEAVLAVSMGADGVRTYILSAPVYEQCGATFAPWLHFNQLGVCTFAKWINPLRHLRALVTQSALLETVVSVHGALDTPRHVSQEIFRANSASVIALDVAEPGNIAFVTQRGQSILLHLLTLQPNGSFAQRSLDLCQAGLRRSDVPTEIVPISLAIGDEQVAVGYSPKNPHGRGVYEAPGLVEVYCIESGELVARRLLPESLPTALATCGTRLLIGASDANLAQEYKNHGHASAIYALTTKGSANYTVCSGDQYNRHWMPGCICMDKISWCYARLQLTAFDEVATIIEHAAVPTR